MARLLATALTNEQTEKVMLTPDGMKEDNIGLNLYFKPGYALGLLRNNIVGPNALIMPSGNISGTGPFAIQRPGIFSGAWRIARVKILLVLERYDPGKLSA